MKLIFLFVVVAFLAFADKSEQHETGTKGTVCYESICISHCLTIGRGRGRCVEGRCKCEKEQASDVHELIQSEDLMEDGTEPQMDAKCSYESCHMECLKKKFRRGWCIRDECHCLNV